MSNVMDMQAPAAEALDSSAMQGLNKRLDSLESSAKDKLVEQVGVTSGLSQTLLQQQLLDMSYACELEGALLKHLCQNTCAYNYV